MIVLDKISIRAMLSNRKTCDRCFGKGYEFVVPSNVDPTKFRIVRPCPCVRQIVKIDEEKHK